MYSKFDSKENDKSKHNKYKLDLGEERRGPFTNDFANFDC